MIIQSKKLSSFSNLRHGISTKNTGHLLFSKHPDTNQVIIDRTKFCQKVGVDANETIVMGEQQHTGNVALVTLEDVAKGMFDNHSAIPQTDGMVATDSEINLVVYTADCLPLLLYDPAARVIGVAHAGWQGILKDIVPHTIEKMIANGATAKNIVVYIGPALCGKHFEVHSDVADQFIKKFTAVDCVTPLEKSDEKGAKFLVDMQRAVLWQLEQLGVGNENIEISEYCTWEHNDLFPSYRKEGKDKKDTIWSVIGMV